MRGLWRAIRGLRGTSTPPAERNWERYAGQAYLDLACLALEDAREATTSLERRAAGLLTSSGAFVTVLFGLAAGVVGEGLQLRLLPRLFVTEAIVFLLWAALFAVIVQVPRTRFEASSGALLKLTADTETWQSRHWIGTRRTAESMANSLRETRRINDHKAWSLRVAFILQGLAIVMLGTGLAVAVANG